MSDQLLLALKAGFIVLLFLFVWRVLRIQARDLRAVPEIGSGTEITSHRSLSGPERAGLGIGPGTVRVSVGIEAAEDIVADFTQALAA